MKIKREGKDNFNIFRTLVLVGIKAIQGTREGGRDGGRKRGRDGGGERKSPRVLITVAFLL